MDRKIVYTGEIPLGDDFLNSEKNALIALGMAIKAILGTSTIVDGLACTPTGPASMQVIVGPGSIYSLVNVDGTAYGDLGSDTTHQIVKQGLSLDNTTLSCPAPSTSGNSINYLIQVAYEDVDTDSVVLPYFDASNPPVAFAGPANTGVSQNTTRKGECVISVKAGASATTGTQTTPAPDAGFMGLWYVTVPNGATSITSGNIHLYTGTGAATGSTAFWSSPFIAEKLNDKVSIATGDLRWQPIGGGGTARTRLTNATTYHVSTTGNDTTGDGSSGTPWATVQHAVNVIANTVDLAGFNATLQCSDGTYGSFALNQPLVGGSASNLIINGNSVTPTNVIFTTSSGTTIGATNGGEFTIQNLEVANTASGGACVAAEADSFIIQGVGVVYGAATSGFHIATSTGGQFLITANYTISGGAVNHYLNTGLGQITINSGITVTVTGTPAFSDAFATANTGLVYFSAGCSFSGSATGVRYLAENNGVINTQGGGATFLPGSSAGSAPTGLYV